MTRGGEITYTPTTTQGSRPWWLWPNLLALDAPAIAVVWQLFLARSAGVEVPPAATVTLGLVVWGVYLADHVLDARHGASGTDRHRAAGRYSVAGALAAAIAFVCASILAFGVLPRAYVVAGGAVAATTAAYLVAIHAVRRARLVRRGAKEMTVGFVFAAGSAVPLIAAARPMLEWLPAVTAFAGLCWLNCALISRWEEGCELGSWGWHAVIAGGLAVGAACWAPTSAAEAVIASTCALAVLHAGRTLLTIRLARVLADVALFTPLATGWWS